MCATRRTVASSDQAVISSTTTWTVSASRVLNGSSRTIREKSPAVQKRYQSFFAEPLDSVPAFSSSHGASPRASAIQLTCR